MAAAMVSKASSRGAIYAVISFPLLLPVLAVAIHGCGFAISGQNLATAASDARLLTYYCGASIAASLMLFTYIWEN
jgi:heme exporter protein B